VKADQKLGPQAKTTCDRSGLGDGTVLVTPIEKDRYERTVAELFVKPRPGIPGYQPEEEIFLNGEMVEGLPGITPYSGNCPNKEVIRNLKQYRGNHSGF